MSWPLISSPLSKFLKKKQRKQRSVRWIQNFKYPPQPSRNGETTSKPLESYFLTSLFSQNFNLFINNFFLFKKKKMHVFDKQQLIQHLLDTKSSTLQCCFSYPSLPLNQHHTPDPMWLHKSNFMPSSPRSGWTLTSTNSPTPILGVWLLFLQ